MRAVLGEGPEDRRLGAAINSFEKVMSRMKMVGKGTTGDDSRKVPPAPPDSSKIEKNQVWKEEENRSRIDLGLNLVRRLEGNSSR